MSESNAARVLQAAGTEAVYTVCGFLKRYLTGFSFEDGCVIADRDGVTVYTDARYIEAEIEIEGKMLRAASLYLPNGNPPYNNPDDESKFEYKLKWMDAFYQHVSDLAERGEDVVLGGDYNVILTDEDVYNPELFRNNALFRKEVRERFKAIEYLGFYDAFRLKHPSGEGYTFWDYSGKSLAADEGMRIDYLLLSPRTADRLELCETDKEPRMSDKPSDHTPLTAELKW